jgi:hypothetical protein
MRLFKYAPLVRIDILLKEAIRYTQPSDLNDPYEMRFDFESLTSDDFTFHRRAMGSPEAVEGLRASAPNYYNQLPAETRANLSIEETSYP